MIRFGYSGDAMKAFSSIAASLVIGCSLFQGVLSGGDLADIDLVQTKIVDLPFMQVPNIQDGAGERAAYSIAFHPDFATNGYFYVHHSVAVSPDTGGRTGSRVVRFGKRVVGGRRLCSSGNCRKHHPDGCRSELACGGSSSALLSNRPDSAVTRALACARDDPSRGCARHSIWDPTTCLRPIGLGEIDTLPPTVG